MVRRNDYNPDTGFIEMDHGPIPRAPCGIGVDVPSTFFQEVYAERFGLCSLFMSYAESITERAICTTDTTDAKTLLMWEPELMEHCKITVKVHPGDKKTPYLTKMTEIMFDKEEAFYLDLLPELKKELGFEMQHQTWLVHRWRYPVRILAFYKYVTLPVQPNIPHLYLQGPMPFRMPRYHQLKRTDTLDEIHTRSVVESLACFHTGGVFCFKRFQMLANTEAMQEVYSAIFDDQNGGEIFSDSYKKKYAKIARCCGCPEVADFFEKMAPYAMSIFKALLQNGTKFNVLCHGGPWINDFFFYWSKENGNMKFSALDASQLDQYRFYFEDRKFDEEPGKKCFCTLVDFQTIRNASPALDLAFVMYTTVDQNIRREKLGEILDSYYGVVKDIYKLHKLEVLPFTREELEEEYKKKSLYGALMMMDYVHRHMAEKPYVLKHYKEREVQDIIDDEVKEIEASEDMKKHIKSILEELKAAKVFDNTDPATLIESLKSS